jgi:hypothetical protein
MTDVSSPALGWLALAVLALLLLAALVVTVKVRLLSARGLGVTVYDFGADLRLPPVLRSRSYRVALYLTMKSLPRDGAEPSSSFNAPAPSR